MYFNLFIIKLHTMAQHNANFTIVPLSSGLNDASVCGDGITAATVHQVFCTDDGEVEVVALGGGEMTVSLTSGQYINVMCSSITINSGVFVGFRAKANRGNRLLG